MARSSTLPLLPFLLACGDAPDACPVGQIPSGEDCVDYVPGDPEPSTGWQPGPGLSWQIQYTDTLDLSLQVEVYDLDLFDPSDSQLAQASQDAVLLCYFSAGSFEDWREDAGDFPKDALGRGLDGWAGEWWLDISDPTVREIMEARMDLAVERGCDAVDPDNVNGWENNTGFGITTTMQLEYNRFLADAAHVRGLSVALKNDQLQLPELADWFDLAVNEECATYEECDAYSAFTAGGKPVLHIEYVEKWSKAEDRADEVCGVGPSLDTLIKTWELGAERLACP